MDDAACNGRLGGIPLSRAQLHHIMRPHFVRSQRNACQCTSALKRQPRYLQGRSGEMLKAEPIINMA